MTTVTNKTKKPLKIPLPGGKFLRLGPGHSGQITPKASTFAPLVAFVEAGEIEISGQDGKGGDGSDTGRKGPSSRPGRSDRPGIRHVGDR